MWGGLYLCFIFFQPGLSYYMNNDAAYIFDNLMSDYQAGPDDHYYVDYPNVQPQEPALPPAINDNTRINQDEASYEHQFPSLNPRQKQFAVNPGMGEYKETNPDFLQYRLEELDQPPEEVQGQDDAQFEEELQSILGSVSDLDDRDPAPADKRGMLGLVRAAPLQYEQYDEENSDDFFFTSLVAGATAATVFIIIGAGYCYHKTSMKAKAGEDVEYPAYGVTGPAKECSPAGDRKLAQSAQMYHYQHQKNQMIAINRGSNGTSGQHDEESEAEIDGEEGDYTVYECPGLASTDEMEVKNPLFNDDPTPKNP